MSEDEGSLSVSALRAQIQEKLSQNGQNGFQSLQKLSKSASQGEIENGHAVPPSPNRSPPIPAHKSSLPPETLRSPPPPPPPHRTDASRRTSSSKPPIAPKPEMRKVSVAAPSIVVDPTTDEESFSREGSVRTKAKELEHLGLKLRNGSVGSVSDTTSLAERPISMISTVSAQSEMTDSDSDDDRPAGMLRAVGLSILNPGGLATQVRRPSALCFNGDTGMHDKIMDELKRQGVVRASGGIYKKKAETASPRSPRKVRGTARNESKKEEENGGIPDEIGRMRDDKKLRKPDVTLSMASTSTTQSDESYDRDANDTGATDRSSFYTTVSEHDIDVKDYDTGDPAEDKRLKKLHYAANEFYSVQLKFVKYLIDMAEVYPNYVAEFGRRLDKDLLATPPHLTVHPVRQIQALFQQLIPVHKIFLDQFANQNASWSSENPGMSVVFEQYGDFLKMCKPFLKAKSTLVHELTKLREENRDFDNATVAFEQKIFQHGIGAVVQQLDQIHQNFMRYKILMMSYQNYLLPDSEEHKRATSAIQKLEAIAQKVNEDMGLPSNEELFRLYDRFQTLFNVFAPGRRLIRQGEVLKQTRKECQPRYIVLFSDIFWICRITSLSSGLFDLNRSYPIPVEYVTASYEDHEDFETQLNVKSKEKSFRLIFKTAREKGEWEKDIRTAREAKRRYKRRMSEAKEKERRQKSTQIPMVKQPTLPEEEDITSTKENETPGISRSQSVDTPSQPSTPVDDPHGSHFPSPLVPKGRIRRQDRDKPLWIPDEASSKCLMDGCGTMFTMFNRRHHCRDCGFLICSKCSGRAPLSKEDFKKELVCPECYGKILDKYVNGVLFPKEILSKMSNGDWRVTIKKGKNNSVLVEPRSLFQAPVNMGLKRMSVESRVTSHDDSVFNEVFVKTREGAELPRFAQLTDGMILQFFKFRLDKEPLEQHVIYGFELNETALDEGGTLFELIHRNQIQTDRKEHVIVFRVQHEKSVHKWSAALRSALGMPKEDDAS